MKKILIYSTLVLTSIIGLCGLSFSGTQEGMPQGHNHEEAQALNSGHSGQMGKMIRQARVEGYGFMYHLIDIPGEQSGAAGGNGTHHLMVYISTPDGQPADSGTVGYLIKGPEAETQQKMAMAMGGGFGADVSFSSKGAYAVKTKAVIDGRTLTDDFIYQSE